MINQVNNKIKFLLSQMSIRKLFVALLLILGVLIISVFTVSRYKTLYSAIYKERLSRLKYVMEYTYEILKDESYYVKTHRKSLARAQQDVINTTKDVHFENDDYIWIANYNGTIVSHPNKEFIGINLKKYKEANGYEFGYDLIEFPQKHGSGYIHYHWVKPGTKDKDVIYPKVSYVFKFDDWKWVVGTGAYTDDIKFKVLKAMFNWFYPVIFVILLMVFIFRYVVWATIITPIEELSDKSLRLAGNDLTVTISDNKSKNEFGTLYRAFNKFVEFFKEKRENEKKLSLIHDNIIDSLITADDKGIIQSANPATEKMFGYSQTQLVGMHVNELVSPDIFENCNDVSCQVKYFRGKFEVFGVKSNKEKFNAEVTINEVSNEVEEIIILLIRDITEQKQVEKMKNEFVSVVSHELRTPLTSIRGSLGLLLSGVFPAVDGKVKDLLEIAHNNSLRLINLINDILDIEKVAAGKMEFQYEPAKVSKLIEDTVIMNKPYADKFKVRYRFVNNLDEDILLKIDKARFTQILTNLLSNATKFSPENDEVTVIAEQKNDSVKISVKDNGPGIPLNFRDKIFAKFTQADSSDTRQKSGTGLGLSICKSFVEKMGGEIGFESEIGQGTTFYINFPIFKEESSLVKG